MIPKMPETCLKSGEAKFPVHPADEPLLLTIEEAGAKLRLGRTSIFALLAAGDQPDPGQHLKRVRIGGATRVTLASVLRLADDQGPTVLPISRGER